MSEIEAIRHSLISEIKHIDDLGTLSSIKDIILKNKKDIGNNIPNDIEAAIITVRKGWTLDKIVEEQNIDQITYPEIREIVESIDWEVSVEDLLQSLD
ncbi:MAG: hypothetical protein AAF798_19985 [Bacteroidota bacterium]